MVEFLYGDIAAFVAAHGYWVVALVVGIESAGIPVPGETVLVTAAVFAGSTGELDIAWIIAAAVGGAVIGDNVGFAAGRRFGVAFLERAGRLFRLNPSRIAMVQRLIQRHGGKVVFFGRFVALLRILAAFLAGSSRMSWTTFLVCNVAGGVVWASVFGLGGYLLGEAAHRLLGRFGFVAAIGAVAVGLLLAHRLHTMEERLMERESDGLPPA
jgi:membrane protein DedA with SNARE-associated domain